MRAEIIAVGTELLLGDVVNTNGAEIARMLSEIGIGVYHQTVVGDNAQRLSDAVRTAAGRGDLVMVTGGLGPTEDDLTRETLAEVLGLPLHRDEKWAEHLQYLFEHRYGQRSGSLPQNNFRQAMVPEGATLLPNSRGSAPGILLSQGGVTYALVPGPPGEMRALMREEVLPHLVQLSPESSRDAVLLSRVLRVIGVGESRVAELLESLLAGQSNPTIAPLAQAGEMCLRITAHAPDRERARQLNEMVARQIYTVLGDASYGEDSDTLESVTGALLTTQQLTVATAESCTGGLIAHRLTNVPGSSRYFLGGITAYSNELKHSALRVPPDLLAREGAVSAPVAEAMAQGALALTGSNLALAVTGIAGPDGGSEAKPVGLTYIALADDGQANRSQGDRGHTNRGEAHRPYTIVGEHRFSGSREEIKARAAQAALELLRQHLIRGGRVSV